MGRFSYFLNSLNPRTGRVIDEQGHAVNVADISREMRRAMTMFGELRTAEAFTVWEIKSTYGLSALNDKTILTGSGAVTNDGTEYRVRTGATVNSTAVLETRDRIRYVAGLQGVPGAAIRGLDVPTGTQVYRWGPFDDDTGFGMGWDANGLFTFRRRGGVDIIDRREDWIDPLDGSGPSGLNIDLMDVNIWRQPFRFYGSGPVQFEVADEVDPLAASVTEFHAMSAAGTAAPIVNDPNQHYRIEVSNGADGGDVSLFVAGRHYTVIGRYKPNVRAASQARVQVSCPSGQWTPLVAARQKSDFKTVSVRLDDPDVTAASSDVEWEIRYFNTDITSGFVAPDRIPAGETAMEFNTTATAALTDGQRIYGGIAIAGAGPRSGRAEASVPSKAVPEEGTAVLCARPVGGTSATVNAVFNLTEEW